MFLGLDLGTSAVKALLFDGAKVVATAASPLQVSSPHPGWSEQNPADWITATVSAVQTLSASGHRAALDAVQGIGLSGQMHGAVLLGADQSVLRPCILWNDSRSAPDSEALNAAMPDLALKAGVPAQPGFTASKIAWVAGHEPEVHARIRHILLPKDYLGLWLHGALATDPSDAAGTLWFDQAARSWDAELCAATLTDPAWLPTVKNSHDCVGPLRPEAALALGLRAGISVYAGGGDAAVGAVALGATVPGRGVVSLGTSGQLFLCTDGYEPRAQGFVHAFAHVRENRYYQMFCMLNGARPMAWFSSITGQSVGDMIACAELADPRRAPICLPYLTGERSPHGDPHIRGAFYGLEDTTGRADMAYAVLEAVAFTFADAALAFGDTLNAAPHLFAIGGGARSDFLLSMIATAMQRPLARCDGAEAGPALGAAKLAAYGAGALGNADLDREAEIVARFDPAPMSDWQANRLSQFRKLYACLKPMRDA